MPARVRRHSLIRRSTRTGRCGGALRLVGWCLVAVLCLLAAACVQPPPIAPTPVSTAEPKDTVVPGPRIPSLSPSEAIAEAERLRLSLSREVPQSRSVADPADAAWIQRAKAATETGSLAIDHPQLIVVVDRNPRVQQMRIVLAQPKGAVWLVIGGSKVSTGQAGRHDYYITPTGVFLHTDGILDYRALGTFNENHIRGRGLKGMRVWDFGWQTAEKGWRADRETGDIRLLMHATDPDYLEQRLGRPASQGCVRIPAAMNRFLDRHSVLDADYLRAASFDPRFNAILPAEREPNRLAGSAMVIVDSAQQD